MFFFFRENFLTFFVKCLKSYLTGRERPKGLWGVFLSVFLEHLPVNIDIGHQFTLFYESAFLMYHSKPAKNHFITVCCFSKFLFENLNLRHHPQNLN